MLSMIRAIFTKLSNKLEEVMATKHAGRLILIGIFIIAVILIVGSIYFFGPDNFFEERAEEVIKEHTGMEIDLTPSTPENISKLPPVSL